MSITIQSLNKTIIGQLKTAIESSHINFLVGSGMSMPYLITLGNIENFITELDNMSRNSNLELKDQITMVRGSIYNLFFEKVIEKNLSIIVPIKIDESDLNIDEDELNLKNTIDQYTEFFTLINQILVKRKSSILNKQINIFTTNIDIFLEIGAEYAQVEYSDGFNGKFHPKFNINNFRKSVYRNSFHYDNNSEVPVFNIIKMHGSLTWEATKSDDLSDHNNIIYNNNLKTIKLIKSLSLSNDQCVQILSASDDVLNKEAVSQTIKSYLDDAKKILEGDSNLLNLHESFINSYQSQLAIVNPTKAKFKETVIDQTYYESLRLYTNVLEKENSVLLVMGFSFADEHIRSLTLRAANFNPTLKVYIIAYSEVAANQIQQNLQEEQNACNHNITIFYPDSGHTIKTQGVTSNTLDDAVNNDLVVEEQQYNYDFKTINRDLFTRLRDEIEHSNNESDKIKNAE
jgi:hypothetical protein